MEFSLEKLDLVFQFGSGLAFVIKSSLHLHRNVVVDCNPLRRLPSVFKHNSWNQSEDKLKLSTLRNKFVFDIN